MTDVFKKQEMSIIAERTPFGVMLSEKRKSLNLTQKDVAKFCKVSRAAYSLWEIGNATPSLLKINNLCKILKTTPNELFGFED